MIFTYTAKIQDILTVVIQLYLLQLCIAYDSVLYGSTFAVNDNSTPITNQITCFFSYLIFFCRSSMYVDLIPYRNGIVSKNCIPKRCTPHIRIQLFENHGSKKEKNKFASNRKIHIYRLTFFIYFFFLLQIMSLDARFFQYM